MKRANSSNLEIKREVKEERSERHKFTIFSPEAISKEFKEREDAGSTTTLDLSKLRVSSDFNPSREITIKRPYKNRIQSFTKLSNGNLAVDFYDMIESNDVTGSGRFYDHEILETWDIKNQRLVNTKGKIDRYKAREKRKIKLGHDPEIDPVFRIFTGIWAGILAPVAIPVGILFSPVIVANNMDQIKEKIRTLNWRYCKDLVELSNGRVFTAKGSYINVYTESPPYLKSFRFSDSLICGLTALSDTQIAGCDFNGALRIYDFNRNIEVRAQEDQTGNVYTNDPFYALSSLTDGRVAAGSYNSHIYLCDWRVGSRWGEQYYYTTKLSGHTDSVLDLVQLPPYYHLLSASKDNTVKAWDLRFPKECHMTYQTRSNSEVALAALPNGYFATRSKKEIKLWKQGSAEAFQTITTSNSYTAPLKGTDDNEFMYVDGENNHIVVRPISQFHPIPCRMNQNSNTVHAAMAPIFTKVEEGTLVRLNLQHVVNLDDRDVPFLLEKFLESRLLEVNLQNTSISLAGIKVLCCGLRKKRVLIHIVYDNYPLQEVPSLEPRDEFYVYLWMLNKKPEQRPVLRAKLQEISKECLQQMLARLMQEQRFSSHLFQFMFFKVRSVVDLKFTVDFYNLAMNRGHNEIITEEVMRELIHTLYWVSKNVMWEEEEDKEERGEGNLEIFKEIVDEVCEKEEVKKYIICNGIFKKRKDPILSFREFLKDKASRMRNFSDKEYVNLKKKVASQDRKINNHEQRIHQTEGHVHELADQLEKTKKYLKEKAGHGIIFSVAKAAMVFVGNVFVGLIESCFDFHHIAALCATTLHVTSQNFLDSAHSGTHALVEGGCDKVLSFANREDKESEALTSEWQQMRAMLEKMANCKSTQAQLNENQPQVQTESHESESQAVRSKMTAWSETVPQGANRNSFFDTREEKRSDYLPTENLATSVSTSATASFAAITPP